MKKTEVIQLFKVIKECYQNFEVSEEKINVWHVVLADITFEKAQKNLMQHIKTNSFVPTPADIIKRDSDSWVDYDKLREDTLKRLAEIEENEMKAIAPPPRRDEVV